MWALGKKHILSHLKIHIKKIVMLTFSLYQRTKYTFTTKNMGIFFLDMCFDPHMPPSFMGYKKMTPLEKVSRFQ